MSNSVRPRGRQPTRLPRPWDSPGKNSGVGCHLLLQCMTVKSESKVAQSCPTRRDPTRLLCPWDFPGKSTGVGQPLKALFVVPSYLLFIKAVFHYVVVSSPSCVQLFATPIDYITPGSSVHGISQARILE